MTFSRTASRSNIAYLRRRPKRPVPKPTAAAAPAASPPTPDRPKIDTRHRDVAPAPATAQAQPPTPAPPVESPRISLTRPATLTDAPTPAPAPTPTPAPPSPGISLSRPAASPPPAAARPATPPPAAAGAAPKLSLKRPAPPKPALPDAKRVHGRVLLTADVPAATLDRRQSAIGSLAFEVVGGGDVSAFWELMDGSSGLVDAHSGVITSPMYGRRPIVELTGHRLLIGLRHVRELRRLVVLVSGSEPDLPQRLVMDLHDESTLETTHTTANGPVIAALALYNVDGELVIRREGFGFATTDAVSTAYGIPVTWLPPVQRH